MTSDQLRVKFLNFFRRRGHTIVPSDSLIPQHDPTLLFTGAGMNQFKDQFMGRNIAFRRAATCQKCLRTADLEKVGSTPGHHTFFEMLGNFSFGDYFKKEAIGWAWEFMTKEINIAKERLWVSVYEEDDEAYSIWKDIIGIEKNKIVRLGDKDNFWPSEAKRNGPNGPCGPCSEIFYDWGSSTGCRRKECDPSCDCGRFVEVWNLVFTQYDRREGGILEVLPTKNIDTGMGLERLTAVIQKKMTNFEIDAFNPIIKSITQELNVRYGAGKTVDAHINAIADHIRAVAFAISDGIRPSNEGRGFVIRKLIRKSSQRSRSLGFGVPFIYKIIPSVCAAMKAAYPELTKKREDIASVVLKEEINLKEVLDTLLPVVEEELVSLKEEGQKTVPASIIFKYYDEKGLPLDLIEERARANDLEPDLKGFEMLLEQQKSRSRDKSKVAGSIFFEKLSDISLKTEFISGKTDAKAKVVGILNVGDMVHIALDKTVFYGESGGQAGDRGEIVGKNLKVVVNDAKRYEETIVHIGKIREGEVKVGDEVTVRIDVKRREDIKKNHTATHLLHSALKRVLGDHVRQYGSLVEEDRLRFDFTHTAKMDESQIKRVEEMVQHFIEKDMTVNTQMMRLEDAKRSGAIALFGEKYKDKVMVRTIKDISKELCGGTHVDRTGQIGAFKIISESSIAQGVRRIEAITGDAVYNWLKIDIQKTISEYKSSLERMKRGFADVNDTIKRIEDYLRPVLFKSESILQKDIMDLGRKELELWLEQLKPEFIRTIDDLSLEFKRIKKHAAASRQNELKVMIDDFIKGAKSIGDIRIISQEIPDADVDLLRSVLDGIREYCASAVIILGCRDSRRADLVLGVTADLVKRGVDASALIKKIARFVDGTGGGRQDLAQAGGRRPDGLREALDGAYAIIKEEMAK